MSFPFRAFIVLMGGLFASSVMMGRQHGDGWYGFSIFSRVVPNSAAERYWERALKKNPALITVKDAETARNEVWSLFREDLRMMKWTWDRELNWTSSKGFSSSSGIPPTKSPR
jgi:hypothetical protein